MNDKNSMDYYLYDLCTNNGTIVSDSDGQFSAGFCEEVWLYQNTLYTFYTQNDWVELVKKEVHFD